MKLINFLRRATAAASRGRLSDPEPWWRDPLSHPDIRAMSAVEIADLPFDPSRIGGVHPSGYRGQ